MTPERAAQLLRDSDPSRFDDHRSQAVEQRVLAELRTTAVDGTPGVAKGWSKALVAGAAAVALAAALVLLLGGGSREAQRELSLKDGSRAVSLSPGARVLPELVAEDRVELRQTAGSVQYDVTPRPARWFVVHVGGARVEVLGTAFRVDHSEKAIHVSVQRGRVRVVHGNSRAELSAGEEVTLATKAELPPASQPPPAAPAASAPGLAASNGTSPNAEAAPLDSERMAAAPSAAELFLRADQARQSGDSTSALRHLRELLRAYPRDGRATLARFTIGRLESARGNSIAAAEAFESCGSALSGEALAEAALARAAAGQSGHAKALAARYSSEFPSGPRRGALDKLAR